MDEPKPTPEEAEPQAEEPNSVKKARRSGMLEQLDSFAYVNITEVVSNNWDVRVALGERIPNGASQPRIGIVMSHQHFKAFVGALTQQLTRLEKVMGEIRLYAPDEAEAAGEQ